MDKDDTAFYQGGSSRWHGPAVADIYMVVAGNSNKVGAMRWAVTTIQAVE